MSDYPKVSQCRIAVETFVIELTTPGQFSGEFIPENQLKLKTEAEKEKSKLDPWKLKHFEPIWGERGQSQANRQPLKTPANFKITTADSDTSCTTSQSNKSLSPNSLAQRRTRTVGAVTRSSAAVQHIESPTKV